MPQVSKRVSEVSILVEMVVSGVGTGVAFSGVLSWTMDEVAQAEMRNKKQTRKDNFCIVVVLLMNRITQGRAFCEKE